MLKCAALAVAGALLPVFARSTALAQTAPATWDAGSLQLTRTELQALLDKYEQVGRSASYSDEFKLRRRSEVELVRRRLTEGDFQVGDQVYLAIEGEPAPWPLTLSVAPGRVLILPRMGELSLVGTLRSELQDRAREHVARYVKNPVIQTRSLIRLGVFGFVGTPGYIVLPAESILADAITTAGGPSPTAKLSNARIERGSETIYEGDLVQRALTDGRTLDQLSLRSGDQLYIPTDAGTRAASWLRMATMVPAAILALAGLIRIL